MKFVLVRTLLRNKLIVLMITLNIAISFAIACNSIKILMDTWSNVRTETGVQEEGLWVYEFARSDGVTLSRDDLSIIERLLLYDDGVSLVAHSNSLPFAGNEWTIPVSTDPAGNHAISSAEYIGTDNFISTLGLVITSGRDFAPEEFQVHREVLPDTKVAIITEELGRHLFRSDDSVGKIVYIGGRGYTVIGTVARLARPKLGDTTVNDLSVILPVAATAELTRLTLARARHENSADISDLIVRIGDSLPIVYVRSAISYSEIKKIANEGRHYILSAMTFVAIISIGMGWLGVSNLTEFWVRSRLKTYLARRILGATRKDIIALITLEGQFVAILGCGVGILFALALNLAIARVYGGGALSVGVLTGLTLSMMMISLLVSVRPALQSSRLDLGKAVKESI